MRRNDLLVLTYNIQIFKMFDFSLLSSPLCDRFASTYLIEPLNLVHNIRISIILLLLHYMDHPVATDKVNQTWGPT